MAPQRLEKIESAPGNGMGSEASNLQDLVHGRAADRARLRLTSRGNDEVAKLQKKAPNALKSRDAELKSALAFRRLEGTANRPALARRGQSAPTRRKASMRSSEIPRSRKIASPPGPGGEISAEVREKRGAGAGCGPPSPGTKVARKRLCGCAGASSIARIGVTQASEAANAAAHSSRGRLAKAASIRARISGHPSRIPTICESRWVEPKSGDESVEKLRLQRAHGDELGVGAAIDAIEGRAAVEQIGRAPIAPAVLRLEAVDHRHQESGTVGHRGVDDLAASRVSRLQQSADALRTRAASRRRRNRR